MLNKVLTFLKENVVLVLVGLGIVFLVFGVWSCHAKNAAIKNALVQQGKAEVLQGQLDAVNVSTKGLLKKKDEELAKEREKRKKLEGDVLVITQSKDAISLKYFTLLGQIATKSPDDVVLGINGYISNQAVLLNADVVQFTMFGAKTTLRLFGEGKRDAELLVEDKKLSLKWDAEKKSYEESVKKLGEEAGGLKVNLSTANAAVVEVKKSRDDWHRAADNISRWDRIEKGVIGAAVIFAVLKYVLKVI